MFRCLLLFVVGIIIVVGRFKEIQDGSHGVVDPLSFVLKEECVVITVRAESG